MSDRAEDPAYPGRLGVARHGAPWFRRVRGRPRGAGGRPGSGGPVRRGDGNARRPTGGPGTFQEVTMLGAKAGEALLADAVREPDVEAAPRGNTVQQRVAVVSRMPSAA